MHMIRREIEVDPATDEALNDLANQYGGDLGQALAELVHSREGIESFLDQVESVQQELLRQQRDASGKAYSEGRVVPWETIKRRNRL